MSQHPSLSLFPVKAVIPSDKRYFHISLGGFRIKHRRRTTAAQLEVLDAYFEESRKPDMETRRQISSKLGMTIREVQVWVSIK